MGESEALPVRLDDACREGLGQPGLVTDADDGLDEGGASDRRGLRRRRRRREPRFRASRDAHATAGRCAVGMGRSWPAPSVPPRRCSAAPSSRAKSGLPPDAFQSLISTGRANVTSRRSRNSSCVAPRLRPRTRTVRSRFSSTAPLTHSGTSSRTASTVATRSWRSRATAYRIADSEAASSHWTSSTARQIERSAASSRSAPRKRQPRRVGPRQARSRRAAMPPPGPLAGSAADQARRRRPPRRACPSKPGTRSQPRPARDETTRHEIRGRLQGRRAASHSAVLPIPASPVTTAIDGSSVGRVKKIAERRKLILPPHDLRNAGFKRASKPRFYDPLGSGRARFSRDLAAQVICDVLRASGQPLRITSR